VDLVRWRLGLAHCADYVDDEAVVRRALVLLGDDPPVLVRSVIFIVARAR
jgi:hypothetical protein